MFLINFQCHPTDDKITKSLKSVHVIQLGEIPSWKSGSNKNLCFLYKKKKVEMRKGHQFHDRGKSLFWEWEDFFMGKCLKNDRKFVFYDCRN